MGLEHRLRAVEAAVKQPDEREVAEADARFRRYRETWEALGATMANEHVAIIEADVAAGRLIAGRDGRIVALQDAQRFTKEAARRVAVEIAGGHNRGGLTLDPPGPLALPPAVVAVYLSDPRACPGLECEACGYSLPHHPSTSVGDGRGGIVTIDPRRDYFTDCPLCGGRVGSRLYYYRMLGRINRCPTCDDLRPETQEEAAFLARHYRPQCHCLSVTGTKP